MELSIRRVAKTSSLSGEPFAEGELVESFLFRNEEKELERADLKASELEDWSPPGPLLCRWKHRLKLESDDEAAARRQSLASAEEMFLVLVEPTGETDDLAPEEAENRAILVNLLGLLMERKRLLKPVKGRPGHYLYGSEKREVQVPRVELDPARILPLLAELDGLL